MVNILVMQKTDETDGRTYSARCQNFYLYEQIRYSAICSEWKRKFRYI